MTQKPIAATSQPTKPSWRSPSGRTKAEGKLWSKQNAQSTSVLSRGTKLFASFTALLALTVFYILFLFRGDLRPTVLIFPIADYAYPWAPNGWAIEDANYLVSQAKESAKFYAVKAEDRQDRSWEDWLDAHLKQPNFIAGGPGNSIIFPKYQSLIVYISGHIDTNEMDEPCLLVPLSGTTRKSESLSGPWYAADAVPLKQVLQKICKGMNDRKRNWWSRQPHRKLVVLDIGKLPTRLQIGAASEALNERIRKVVESLDEPELAVMVSCNSGQRSWTLPERGGSNFGLHFARALAGAADPKGTGRINLEQLVKYLEKHVDDTAQSQRLESQIPVCYRGADGKGANEKAQNFEIVIAGNNRFSSPPIGLNRSDFKLADRMADAWDRYSNWQPRMVAIDPWIASEVLARLSNAESLLLSGPSYDTSLKVELETIDSLLGKTVPNWPAEVIVGQSKVLKQDLTIKEIANENHEKILSWLNQTTQADGKVMTEPPKLVRQSAIAFAWSWIVQRRDKGTELLVEGWQRAVAMVEQASEIPSSSLPSRDVVLFEAMIASVRGAIDQNNAVVTRMVKGIPRFLDAHQKLVDLNNPKDPRLWRWLDSQFALHHSFFEALDNWLLATSEGLQRSELLLSELLGAADKESQLEIAKSQKRALESAWQYHDELAMLLPSLNSIAEHESQLIGDSKIASSEPSKLFKLRAILAQPKVDEQGLMLIKEVEDSLRTLKEKHFASAQRLAAEQSTIDPKSRRNISLWLQQSVDLQGVPSTRTIIRKKLVKYFDDPTTLTNASDKRPDQPTQEVTGSTNGTLAPNVETVFADMWWREATNWHSGNKTTDMQSKPNRNKAIFRKQSWDEIAQLSDRVKAVADNLNSDSKQSEARNETLDLAWSSRLMAPFLVRSAGVCPTRHHWAIASQLALITQAKEAMDDFWILPSQAGISSVPEYYSVLAENYLRVAESIPGPLGAVGLANTALTKKCRIDLEERRTASRSWEGVIWSGLPTKPITEPILNPEFQTTNIDAGTILSGSQLKSPTLVSNRPQSVRIDTSQPRNSSIPPLQAFLRGRTSEGTLNIAKLSAVPQLEWNIEQRDTKVRLSSVVSPRQILFVLDCSDSFDELEHEKAKETLLSILDRLPEDDTEVGLLVFGHASRWKLQDGTPEFAVDVAAKLGISTAGRTPENDIDLLVGIKKLSEQTKNEFQSKCSALRKFGFTPLHASIDRGREILTKAKRADFIQHLVVITDGGDNVYTDNKGRSVDNTRQARRYPFGKGPSTIASELSQSSIKRHCIKYAYQSSAGTIDSIQQLFGANEAYDANNSDQLKRALSKILNLRTFTVGIDNKVEPKEFGETFGARLSRPSKLEIKVAESSARQEVLARGGEYFDIRFDPVLTIFRYAPLDEKQFGASVVPQDKSEPQSRVVVLAGDRQGLTRFVRIGVEPVLDTLPPRRPARMWAEMRIVTDENGPERIVTLSDFQWESEKSSPVFRVPIKQGRIKEIRVWFSFQEGHPEKLFLSNWRSRENRALADRMPEPEKSPDKTAPWSVTLKPPSKDRIRWSISPQVSSNTSAKRVDLKRIVYSLGAESIQAYTFTEQPSDVEVSFEKMPDVDRPNTDGWLTTDWLKVDSQ